MADDDNKIVIPVEVVTDDAEKKLDSLADKAAKSFEGGGNKPPPPSRLTSADIAGDIGGGGNIISGGLAGVGGLIGAGSNTESSAHASTITDLVKTVSSAVEKIAPATAAAVGAAAGAGKTTSNFDAAGKYIGPLTAVESVTKRSGIPAEDFHQRTQATKDRVDGDAESASAGKVDADTKPIETKFGKLKSLFSDIFSGGGGGGEAAASGLKKFSAEAEGAEGAAHKIREAIHVLHPVLEEAGVSMGNLGGFARLASAGFGALAVAAGGTALVALSKLGDEVAKSKSRLDSLSGAGKGGGDSHFEELQKTAKDLGTSPSAIQPLAELLSKGTQDTRAADRKVIRVGPVTEGEIKANEVQVFNGRSATPSGGLPQSVRDSVLRAVPEASKGQALPDAAAAAYTEFYKSTTDKQGNLGKGQVSLDAFNKLQDAIPKLADAIAKGVSGSGPGGVGQEFPNGAPDLKAYLQRGGSLTGEQTARGLANIEPELKKEADKIPAGVTEALDHLKAAAEGAAEKLSGDLGLAGAINKLAQYIEGFIPDHKEEKAPQSFGEVFSSDKGDLIGRITGYTIDQVKKQLSNPDSTLSQIKPNAQKLLGGDFSNAYKTEPPPPLTTLVPEQGEDGRVPRKPAAVVVEPRVQEETNSLSQQRSPFVSETNRSALPPGLDPTQYNQTLDGLFTKRTDQEAPAPQPAPAAILPEKQSGAAPLQQTADLGSTLQQLLTSFTAAVTNAPAKAIEQQQEAPGGATIGVRANVEGGGDATATSGLASLAAAAASAAEKLNSITTPSSVAAPEPEPVAVAEGGSIVGHVRGPGNATSDSIPAMLSDGEYVLKAEAVRREGVNKLNDVNAGRASFADGGEINPDFAKKNKPANKPTPAPPADGTGSVKSDNIPMMDVNDKADIRKAKVGLVDGGEVQHFASGGGSKVSSSAEQKRKKEQQQRKKEEEERKRQQEEYDKQVQAEYAAQQSKIDSTRHKSDFVGKFGSGSSYEDSIAFGDTGFALGGIARHFANGGFAGRSLGGAAQHFADGGNLHRFNGGGIGSMVARSTAPVIGLASGGTARDAPAAAKSDMEHWGTIDMRTNHGDVKVATERETMRHLSSTAQKAKRFSTGGKPSWYGGGQ